MYVHTRKSASARDENEDSSDQSRTPKDKCEYEKEIGKEL